MRNHKLKYMYAAALCTSIFLCSTITLGMHQPTNEEPEQEKTTSNMENQTSKHLKKFDVVICGGGTAGVPAAIAAARHGASTLIIEQFGSLGGTQSNAWVTPMMRNSIGDFKLNRGVNLDITATLNEIQPGNEEFSHGSEWYDPAMLAIVQDKLTKKAGVKSLFYATIIGANKENNHIKSIVVATRQGHLTIEGKTFIDATGDAQLSFYAGAELMSGDEKGKHQPMSLRFTMGNIDIEKLHAGIPDMWRTKEEGYKQGYLHSGYHCVDESSPLLPLMNRAVKEGVLEEDDIGYFQVFTMVGRPGELAFNCPKIFGYDPLDAFELSEACQVGREKIFRLAEFMKRYMPGCENAYITVIAPLIGIRESRRVVGEYILTEDDYSEERKFEDVVARNRYPIDIHKKKGTDYRGYREDTWWHDIPYRSIVVKGFDNLWVTGRCISADFKTQSSIRIQAVCRSLGEAAGIAAALCAQKDLKAMELPYKELTSHLDLSLPPDLESPPEDPSSSKHE